MNRLRIFLGTWEIANQTHVLARAFEQMGHQVTTVVRRKNPFYQTSEYTDYTNPEENLSLINAFQSDPLNHLLNNGERLLQIKRMITDHDIYIFQYASSILGRLEDLPLLRALGKRVICMFNGSDTRERTSYALHNRLHGLHPMPYHLQNPDPTGSLEQKLRYVRMAELHADVVTGAPDFLGLAILPYFHNFAPLDTREITPCVPDREVPIVVHAPSHRDIKGTDIVLKAVADLKSEGVAFEFELLEKMPNEVVRQRLSNADIAVDQLYSEYPATFALEAMAAGCAVAGGNRPDTVPYPPNIPCVDIDPRTVRERLRHLIQDKSFRVGLARRGPGHVRDWHHPLFSAAKLLDLFARKSRCDFDHVPDLFLRHFVPAPEEPLSETSRTLNRAVVETLPHVTPELLTDLHGRELI